MVEFDKLSFQNEASKFLRLFYCLVNRFEISTTLVVAQKDPLGCILEAVFGKC